MREPILDSIKEGYTPRVGQIHSLLEIEKYWKQCDLFVLNVPVAGGKSLIATTIAAWVTKEKEQTAAIITPQVLLQDQYTNEFTEIPSLKGKSRYQCFDKDLQNCEDNFNACENYCRGCPYLSARARMGDSYAGIYNLYSYLFNLGSNPKGKENKYADVLIIDEAHSVADQLKEFYSFKMWQHEDEYPDDLNTQGDAIIWMEKKTTSLRKRVEELTFQIIPIKKKLDARAEIARTVEEIKKSIEIRKESGIDDKELKDRLKKLRAEDKEIVVTTDELSNYKVCRKERAKVAKKISRYQALIDGVRENPGHFFYENKMELYRGRMSPCIQIRPITLKHMGNTLWVKHKKVIMLSATLSAADLSYMGLNPEECRYIETPSPIPKENRPIIVRPTAQMSNKNLAAAAEKMAKEIMLLAQEHKGKGLIHLTYGLVPHFQKYLTDDRFMWHKQVDRISTYEAFRKSEEPKILMACGLSEGIDLVGAEYEWQVITKVMFPSLGDGLVVRLKEADPKWYAWQAIRTTIQQYGRICRTPTDKGATYILDSNFNFLYFGNKELFPKYFHEASQHKPRKKETIV